MGFVDTHVHLHFPDFEEDREAVINRARESGVELFINVGTDVAGTQASVTLSEKYDFIYATAGIHPHDAAKADEESFSALEKFLEHPRVVAIGEVGLDFFRDHSPQAKQKEVLRRFIEIHRKSGKPLVLHCRDAYEELMDLFKNQIPPPYSGIIHCFSADRAVMVRLLDLGFYISFAGPLTYKKNDTLREACRACPLDRLLLETDAPFLPPQSRRGKRNESSLLLETAGEAARLHSVSLEVLSRRTTANARSVFSLC